MPFQRRQRIYDHRLVQLVQDTGDIAIATRLGVPRSTATGWIRRVPQLVITAPGLDESSAELRARAARLEKRMHRIRAFLRVGTALFRILQPDLTRLRIPEGREKARLLRANR